MFQNSIFNLEQYPCQIHKKQKVTHICSDLKCNQYPFLCNLCFNQNMHKNLHISHQELLLPINESINSFSILIDNQKNQMDKMYQTTAFKKQNEGLIKKIQMNQRHYQFIDNHIKNLKGQIQKQVDFMIGQFQKKMLYNKQNMLMQLDNYQKIYIQNMQSFRNMMEPLVTFNKKFKYYSNSNNISLKLLSQVKKKSYDWFIQLKKVLNFSSKIMQKPQNYYENIQRCIQYMNNIYEDLPYIKSLDDNKKTIILNDPLNDWLNLKQIKLIQNSLVQIESYRNIGSQRQIMERNRIVTKTNKS